MGQLSRKLHSRRGASILLALMFFLICGFVGAVVIGSATANAEKLQGRRDDQQAYFAVSSAARFLREALDGAACQGVEQKTIYQCAGASGWDGTWSPTLHSDRYAAPTFTLTEGEADGPLTDLLRDAAWTVFQSRTVYTTPTTFLPWSKNFAIAAEGMPEVAVQMTINEAYTAVFTLTTENSAYAMTLTSRAAAASTEATSDQACTHTLTVINEETGEPESSNYTFTYTEYTRSTTVVWIAGDITKGVA